jgi:hypothetical protein
MAAKAAMARRRQRLMEKKAKEEAEALSPEVDAGESLSDATPATVEKGRGSDVLDDLLDDVFEAKYDGKGSQSDSLAKGVSEIKISSDEGPIGEANPPATAPSTTNYTEGPSQAPESTADDGEPMLPSEADAAAAEEEKERKAEDKMKAYRMKRFKKKEKAFKSVEEALDRGDQDKSEMIKEKTSPSDGGEVAQSQLTSPKKKFEGIAKVRRRKLKEEQKKEEMLKEDGEDESLDAAMVMKEKKSASAGKTIELLIIVFFLVSGYLIGYNSIVNSSSEILIAGMDGTVDIGEDMDDLEDAGLQEIKKLKEQLMGSQGDSTLPSFDSTVDPIFGVDFDLLLMEDNFLNSLGRLVVGLHRFVTKIARVPFDMFVPKTWPIFCGISLAVRAGTYGVLGATGMPKKAAGTKDSKGLGEMAFEFVKGMFPKLSTCWELYQLVIGDVLMIFTGLLFAMATTRIGTGEGDKFVGVGTDGEL